MTADPAPRILVVDDEADIGTILGALLRRAGYRVTTAQDGLAALASIGAEPPALVVMDVRMPRLDGLETLRRIRAAPATATLPVILMTANAEPADRAQAMACGADECLAKPFEPADLVARIRPLLERRADGAAPKP
jgi:DNA-binding response OmpR family regulator